VLIADVFSPVVVCRAVIFWACALSASARAVASSLIADVFAPVVVCRAVIC